MQSYSQYSQDLFVLECLKNKKQGYFVEIGSTNGIDINNTFLLEKEFDWAGLCVEPNPESFKFLKLNRKAICINKAIYNKNCKVNFKVNSDWSKISDNKDDINVDAISLNDLLESNNVPKIIDYLSIDCEGSEYDILSVFNFDNYVFKVITVEHNAFYNGNDYKFKIRKLLENNGYIFVKTNTNNPANINWVANIDDFYIHKSVLEDKAVVEEASVDPLKKD